MKVILLHDVENLGKMGAEVTVRSGYARNFLIPRCKAMLSTAENIKIFEIQQCELKDKILENRNRAKQYADRISALKSVIIKAKSGISGKLFGSIGSRDIAFAVTKAVGFKIIKSQVRLPNQDVLKNIGTYKVSIHICDDMNVELDVVVLDSMLV